MQAESVCWMQLCFSGCCGYWAAAPATTGIVHSTARRMHDVVGAMHAIAATRRGVMAWPRPPKVASRPILMAMHRWGILRQVALHLPHCSGAMLQRLHGVACYLVNGGAEHT